MDLQVAIFRLQPFRWHLHLEQRTAAKQRSCTLFCRTASVFFQKVPFARIPVTVLIDQISSSRTNCDISFFAFPLVIQTNCEALAPRHIKITKRYAVGGSDVRIGLGRGLSEPAFNR